MTVKNKLYSKKSSIFKQTPLIMVPVLSFCMSKGRCRHCGVKISKVNLYGELGMGLLFGFLALESGNLYFIILHLVFFSVLYLVTVTDLIDQIIPDSAMIVAIVVRVIAFVLNYYFDFYRTIIYIKKPSLWSQLGWLLVDGLAVSLPLLLLVLLMEKILKKEAMGGGDIKLLFVTGLYLGWQKNILVVFFACIIGIIVGTIQMKKAMNAEESEEEQPFYFPFGPSIALSAVLMLFFGNIILNWYLSLF
jgi:prepilin signal peptidase PulO-like enzyme (type II secretory pathway)